MTDLEIIRMLRLRIEHDGRSRVQYDRIVKTAKELVAGLDDCASDARAIGLVCRAACGLAENGPNAALKKP
jgi:hypothetical protein